MYKFLLLCAVTFTFKISNAQNLYFPPVSGQVWEIMDPTDLGWCNEKIQSMYTYLDHSGSKAFIVLKDGKIVLEKYFGNFTKDSLWVWNSAGKTLTAFTIGIAQQQGFLNISDTTSRYLGTGWTSLTPIQEEKITIRHQLTMTTGLNDINFECTTPSCLTYIADAGTRWAYHNAPYTLLDNVITATTGQTLNAFVTQKIKVPTGITGAYVQIGYNNVFVSNARSMARFGLLLLARGNWNGTSVLNDPNYFDAMTTSSQNINPSYGYLTWLNGKSSFMIPQVQLHFPGPIMPSAPSNVFAAIGKNGQLINIDADQNLVFIRMGQNDGNSLVSTQYNDTIWQKINDLHCTNSIYQISEITASIYPNPAIQSIRIQSISNIEKVIIQDALGKTYPLVDLGNEQFDISALKAGVYFVTIHSEHQKSIHKILIE